MRKSSPRNSQISSPLRKQPEDGLKILRLQQSCAGQSAQQLLQFWTVWVHTSMRLCKNEKNVWNGSRLGAQGRSIWEECRTNLDRSSRISAREEVLKTKPPFLDQRSATRFFMRMGAARRWSSQGEEALIAIEGRWWMRAEGRNAKTETMEATELDWFDNKYKCHFMGWLPFSFDIMVEVTRPPPNTPNSQEVALIVHPQIHSQSYVLGL